MRFSFPHRSSLRLLSVAAAALAAFLVRSLPYRNYLGSGGSYLFFGPDSYDHLRRIVLNINAFPGLPPYDFYYGYPHGIGQVWAPLFDYFLAAVALLVGWGAPAPDAVAKLCFWFPPVLAAFTVPLVYLAGARFFGRSAGVVAAVVLALMPAHILYSFVSRLDHHVAEPVICLAIIISLLKSSEGSPAPAGWRAPLATAFWMVLALLVWRGSVIFWGVVTLALLVHLAALGVRSEGARRVSFYAFRIHLGGALLLLPICGLNLWGTAGGVTAGIVSWFHVVLLGTCALLFLFLASLSRNHSRRTIIPLVAAVILLIFFIPAGRGFVGEFFAGLDVIVGSDPWLAAISELTSILYFRSGRLDLWYPAENFTFLYWLFPVVLLILLARWRQSGWRDFRYPLFLVWGTFFWILPLFRLRYCHLTAVTMAIAAGFLFTVVQELVYGQGARVRFLVPPVLLLLMVAPTGSLLKTIPETGPDRGVKYDLNVALTWLRENTPATSYYEKPDRVPEYGVLADWGLGAHVINVGQRPALATNFGWETHGLFESAAFQALGDPVAAADILDSNRIRYVLLNQVIGGIDDDRAIAEYGFKTGRLKVAASGGFSLQRSMYYRLLARDGGAYDAEGTFFPALGIYRLVYESSATSPFPTAGEVSLVKIFERLPGAVLSGRGTPGERIRLQLGLTSPIGRVLVYRDETTVGSDGRFVLRVPYPTTVASGILKPLGDYLIKVAGRTVAVRVTEDDVYGQASVPVEN